MKRFDKRVVIGTKVLLEGIDWRVVKKVHDTRKWVEIEGLVGSFQRGHVLKFTNK